MRQVLSIVISCCLLGTMVGCQPNSTRIRPQTSQGQDLPPEYPDRANKTGYSTQEQDNNKNNYTEQDHTDYSNNNYTEDANNIHRSSRPNRAVGYWLSEEMQNQIQELAAVKEAKAVVARPQKGAYVGKRNAYIAIRLKKHLSKQEMNKLKQKITAVTKTIEPNVGQVYVSTHDEFMKAVLDYQKHVKVGYPDREMETRIRQLEKVKGKG